MSLELFVFALAALIATTALAHGDEPHKPAAKHDHSAKDHEHSGAKETAFGRPGDPAKVDRTVMIEMRDPVEFSPSEIAVKAGETIRFVVLNSGKHEHEMVHPRAVHGLERPLIERPREIDAADLRTDSGRARVHGNHMETPTRYARRRPSRLSPT